MGEGRGAQKRRGIRQEGGGAREEERGREGRRGEKWGGEKRGGRDDSSKLQHYCKVFHGDTFNPATDANTCITFSAISRSKSSLFLLVADRYLAQVSGSDRYTKVSERVVPRTAGNVPP